MKEKVKDKKISNEYFKYNTETNEITLHDEENSLLCKDLLENNEYKLLKTQNKKLLQAINEILEKQPQPTPSPCPCSKWKDVAISLGTTISYKLKPNTYYKIFYDLNNVSNSNMGKYPMQTIEIFWQETSLSYWVCFLPSLRRTSSINIANNNFIKLITDQGYLWKLQELQE